MSPSRLLPDVLVQCKGKGCLAQMLDVYEAHGGNVIAVEPVPEAQLHSYGVVGVGEGNGSVFPINGMVEKPKPGTAPSNLTILAAIFSSLRYSTFSRQRRPAPAARSRSPTP